jgi:hypothetical protein
MNEYNRIKYLKEKYSQYNVNKGEKLYGKTRQTINKNYYNTQRTHLIDGLLNEINNPQTVKKEVYGIIYEIDNLKVLCRTCSVEQIVAVIILYVQRLHNPVMKEEKTRLWNHYELTWKIYARIIARLLRETRKSRCLPREIK